MQKVFWEDPYQRSLITKITSVNGNLLLLEETIAFSFSGGQESDKAWINDNLIQGSQIEGNLIFYSLDDNHGFHPGQTVTMKIDWPRRHRLMRLHFAAELILEIVTKEFQLEKIGAHIAETKSRIDFIFAGNISHCFEEILAQYNEIITADAKIKTGFSDIEKQKRYWEIEGFSKVPCGGTHVKSTSEVGFVKLKRVNLGKSKERIEIRLVDDV